MRRISPPESKHALDPASLRGPGFTFWSALDGDEAIGCGALYELEPRHGEIKSMRTARRHLRRGVGAAIVRTIIDEASRRDYERLSLETGAQAEFAPARALYERFGFSPCGPFGGYREDPNSVFMTLELARGRAEPSASGSPRPPR